ncbi:MAG: hypothetical protein ACRYG2_37310, partial [Janthinobacterium lividum]
LVVEVHVPLTPASGLAEGEYAFPWIDDVEEFLASLSGEDGEEYDSGEELGEEYLFFLSGASEGQLTALARRVAAIPRVPSGVYVTINDAEGDMGEGRRVDL